MDMPDTRTPSTGIDYVALLSTLVLGIIACVALYLDNDVVAGTAAGAIAGYMVRLYAGVGGR